MSNKELPRATSFYADNVKLVEDTAKRVTNADILTELGGKIVVSGRVVEGDEAIKFLDQMHPTDRMSMIEDMLSAGYFPQNTD